MDIQMKQLVTYFFLFFFCFSACFADQTPISAEQAFRLEASAKDYQTVLINWKIAPGYYLYQKEFKFSAIKPANAVLGDPLFPGDTEILNTIEGKLKVYSGKLIIPIPIIHVDQKTLVLQAHYQGCSKAGYCYPPITKIIEINLAGNYLQPVLPINIDIAPATQPLPQNQFEKLLNGHSLFILILSFLGFGILLSLTPCVLPMIPILSSIIVGKEH